MVNFGEILKPSMNQPTSFSLYLITNTAPLRPTLIACKTSNMLYHHCFRLYKNK